MLVFLNLHDDTDMRAIPKLLSKTKLVRGFRCRKFLYLTIHKPQLEAPITPETQARFDIGNEVGSKAREYFPGGQLINNLPWDFTGALAKTRELLANKVQIIYEAAFEYMGCYARADIIVYSPESQRWKIYEVKSTTKVKPEHYDDVGIQAWIMAKSGLPIEAIHVMHLNPDCRFPDLSNLFKTVDITQEIRDRYPTIQPTLKDIYQQIKLPEEPAIDIGPYCLEPTECGFKDYCWQQKQIPEVSVFNLAGLKQRKWDLYYESVIDLTDDRLTDLNEQQQLIVDAHHRNERYFNPAPMIDALSQWEFPLVFLDFETINPAIPRYNGCKPYEQVPFQFSVHRWEAKDKPITHQAFLHTTADDPRDTLIPKLLEACGETGSIVAYFGVFESTRITELASYSLEYAEALLKLTERIVDPLPILRTSFYDPAFACSYSLKSVAPAVLGDSQSYEGMLVANGGDAQRAFEEIISADITSTRKAKLIEAMLAYCEKDTYVMVELVKWMMQQCHDSTTQKL